jgi:hypothetical protein
VTTPDRRGQLFMAISIPSDFMPTEQDPDAIADVLVDLLNEKRQLAASARAMLDGTYDPETGGPHPMPFMVGGIPSPQWLTPNTLNRLRERDHWHALADQLAEALRCTYGLDMTHLDRVKAHNMAVRALAAYEAAHKEEQ